MSHHLWFSITSFVVQVSELNSELDTKHQEVMSLQRNLTVAQQEKEILEQTLTSLVRVQDDCVW